MGFLIALAIGLALLAAWLHWGRPQARGAHESRFGHTLRVVSALGAFAVFVDIAEDVRESQGTEVETRLVLALHDMGGPFVGQMARAFTFVGSAVPTALLACTLACVAWRRRDRAAGVFLIGVSLVCEGANWALKHTFHRARPTLIHEIAELHSYAFPSGHAMAAACVGGACAITAARLWPRRRTAIALGAILYALGVAWSRVYLGAHWPTDVAAGLCAGTFVLVGGISIFDRWRRARTSRAVELGRAPV